MAEVEDAVGCIGLDVIHLMQAAIEAELQLLRAQLLGQRGGEFSCVLALFVVAVGVAAGALVTGREVSILDEHGRNTNKSPGIEIGGEAQRSDGIGRRIFGAGWRVIGDFPGAAREPEGHIQQQGWAEGLGIVDGEQMRRGLVRASCAGIDIVLEAIVAGSGVPVLGVLPRQ